MLRARCAIAVARVQVRGRCGRGGAGKGSESGGGDRAHRGASLTRRASCALALTVSRRKRADFALTINGGLLRQCDEHAFGTLNQLRERRCAAFAAPAQSRLVAHRRDMDELNQRPAVRRAQAAPIDVVAQVSAGVARQIVQALLSVQWRRAGRTARCLGCRRAAGVMTGRCGRYPLASGNSTESHYVHGSRRKGGAAGRRVQTSRRCPVFSRAISAGRDRRRRRWSPRYGGAFSASPMPAAAAAPAFWPAVALGLNGAPGNGPKPVMRTSAPLRARAALRSSRPRRRARAAAANRGFKLRKWQL